MDAMNNTNHLPDQRTTTFPLLNEILEEVDEARDENNSDLCAASLAMPLFNFILTKDLLDS